MSDQKDLDDLKSALVRGLGVPLSGPDVGYAAFERHQLLTIRVHRAARLNSPDETERQGWLTYFREHFPRGDTHAQRLWEDWRGRLVKDEFSGTSVVVSHGQPHAHWKIVDPGARLYIDLESMWGDFERSVESFITMLGREKERREKTLEKWRKRQWTVQQVVYTASPAGVTTTASSGVFSTSSATAFSPPPQSPGKPPRK